ncbi:MAG: DUF805 domain-containing protein [Bradyrhizobium sp.]|uniref:DUF805 domain-containing protein n=1 Tax=Bradyrhizobium sp. TaxID=376 RepID=UPI0025C39277|nr:DUF805 domain-containing protein [Bradyrhizobium sp.]MBI5260190.1 DUF805 domain-containing protein [Bradyrhizobium sp.]
MDWAWYLFRFDGRISRARFWLAMLIMICWMILLIAIIAAVRGLFGGPAAFKFDAFELLDPATYRSLSVTGLPILLAKLILSVLFLWVYFATSIKRLHDRDKSGWWIAAYFVFPALYQQFADRLPDSWLDLPLALAAVMLSFWGFIEMACLRGTPRTNRFGPDPLPKIRTSPRGSARSTSHSTSWDQHSKLEFVPHKAGPPAL